MVSLYTPVEFLNSIMYEPFSSSDKSMLKFPFRIVLCTIFPDISKIYHEISGLESAVVNTVGPERFHLRPKSNNVISESVGLIAPVWHYVGVIVFAQNFID